MGKKWNSDIFSTSGYNRLQSEVLLPGTTISPPIDIPESCNDKIETISSLNSKLNDANNEIVSLKLRLKESQRKENILKGKIESLELQVFQVPEDQSSAEEKDT